MRFTNKLAAFSIVVASVGAGAAGLALADEGTPKAEILSKYDTNKDGKLDASERQAMREAFRAERAERRQEMLARFDVNKDGKLDEGERKVMADTLAAERFKKLDTNGDGVISLAEFQAGAEHMGGGHHFRHFGGGPEGGTK